eukprot:4934491-Amphidinium_carterae.1
MGEASCQQTCEKLVHHLQQAEETHPNVCPYFVAWWGPTWCCGQSAHSSTSLPKAFPSANVYSFRT